MTTDISPLVESAIREEAARRRLLPFCMQIDPSYIPARHLVALTNLLDRIARGEVKRAVVAMQPRAGKSLTCSRYFPAMYLGRHPERSVILASYSSELAEGNARAVRDTIRSDRYPFKNVRIRDDSRAAGRFQLEQGGEVIAAGIGSGLTGRGGACIVIDDPVADRAAADSPTIRESTWNWYSDVVRTRAHPGAAILIVSTRWHQDDLVGRILASPDAPNWTQLIMPAVCDDPASDPLGRKMGEVLWPERFPLDELPSVERGEISSRSWNALYMQRPSSAAGGIFKRAWFANRYERIPSDDPIREAGTVFTIRPRPNLRILAVDTASKTGISHDYSALATILTDRRDFYVEDITREKLEFNDLSRRIIERAEYYNPRLVLIEEASSGTAILQSLRATTRLPIVPIVPKSSKIARAESVTPLFESGRVRLPTHGAWIEPFIEECTSFGSGGAHDDMVDALVHGLTYLSTYIVHEEANLRASFGNALTSWKER